MRIRRVKLPLRVRFKSLPLTTEDEAKYRAEIKAKAEKQAAAPPPAKSGKPPDPLIIYCGMSWILILFAVCVYISLMGVPKTIPGSQLWRSSPRSSPSSRGPAGKPPTSSPFLSNLFGSSEPPGPKPITRTTYATLEQIYEGSQITFHPGKVQKICSHCKGTGAEGGHKHHMHTCDKCHGTGVVPRKEPWILGFEKTVEEECPKCGGRGFTVEKKCGHCGGTGVVDHDEEITVMLPKGTGHGQRLRLRGLGHQVLGYPPGDIILEVRQKPHKEFTRRGSDLATELKITLEEALTGFEYKIKHLDGHEVLVRSDKIANQKTRFTVPGEGMRYKDSAGELIIRLKIVFPKDISKENAAAVKNILRGKQGEPVLSTGEAKLPALLKAHEEL